MPVRLPATRANPLFMLWKWPSTEQSLWNHPNTMVIARVQPQYAQFSVLSGYPAITGLPALTNYPKGNTEINAYIDACIKVICYVFHKQGYLRGTGRYSNGNSDGAILLQDVGNRKSTLAHQWAVLMTHENDGAPATPEDVDVFEGSYNARFACPVTNNGRTEVRNFYTTFSTRLKTALDNFVDPFTSQPYPLCYPAFLLCDEEASPWVSYWHRLRYDPFPTLVHHGWRVNFGGSSTVAPDPRWDDRAYPVYEEFIAGTWQPRSFKDVQIRDFDPIMNYALPYTSQPEPNYTNMDKIWIQRSLEWVAYSVYDSMCVPFKAVFPEAVASNYHNFYAPNPLRPILYGQNAFNMDFTRMDRSSPTLYADGSYTKWKKGAETTSEFFVRHAVEDIAGRCVRTNDNPARPYPPLQPWISTPGYDPGHAVDNYVADVNDHVALCAGLWGIGCNEFLVWTDAVGYSDSTLLDVIDQHAEFVRSELALLPPRSKASAGGSAPSRWPTGNTRRQDLPGGVSQPIG